MLINKWTLDIFKLSQFNRFSFYFLTLNFNIEFIENRLL
jgi:hypothetical protein